MAPTESTSQLDRIEAELSILNEALIGSLRPGAPPGLVRRVDEGERDRSDIRRLLGDLTVSVRALEASVRALEAVPGKTAITWWDRLGLAVLGLLLSAIGAMIGAALKGAPTPGP